LLQMYTLQNLTFKCLRSEVSLCIRQYCQSNEASGCLRGIRVLDLTRILAGPMCTMLLADLGADVIKVEKPGSGDETRNWIPPSVAQESLYFLTVNRNKKSIAVDLKRREGMQIVKELAIKSDVFVENYLPGKMDELGLGYKELKNLNPRLIYCSISGFGNDGPYAERAGLDLIAASVGGLMSITGPENGDPCKVGIAITDVTTGLYAKGSILAALYNRQTTGLGSKIECNLLSTQVSTLINLGVNYLNTGTVAPRRGTAHESIVPYQSFECGDGKWLTIGVLNNLMFQKLCELLFSPALSSNLSKDERFISNAKRVENRAELIQLLSKQFKKQPLKYWLKTFEESGIPFGPLNDLDDVFQDPQVIHNKSVLEVDHKIAGKIKLLAPAVKHFVDDGSKSNEQVSAFREKMIAPPLLGEHTRSVLSNILNYDKQKIATLLEKQVIQCK
ncbi:hypothetical protein B4U80_11578, partial [Leptotrombidium deliense]